MFKKNKDKNAGLNEEQRLQKQQAMELLKLFREEYHQLVTRYGWVHGIRWTMPTDINPSMPFVTEVFIKNRLEQAALKKKLEENVVVKN